MQLKRSGDSKIAVSPSHVPQQVFRPLRGINEIDQTPEVEEPDIDNNETDELKDQPSYGLRRAAVFPGDINEIQGTEELKKRVKKIADFPLDFIDNQVFTRAQDDAKLEADILASVDLKPGKRGTTPDPYIASLYENPLLSREQEQRLFRKMNYLKFLASNLRGSLGPVSPEVETVERIEALYDRILETRNILIRSNLRLVVNFARTRAHSREHMYELISDGNMSLMKSVDKFDFARGFKLSTYASWSIIKNFARTIPAEYRRHAKERSVSYDQWVRLLGGEERDLDFLDQADLGVRQISAVDNLLQDLSERERGIIIRRFGLDGEDPKKLREIGGVMGISRERVRQIEMRAMEKLRRAAEREKLDFAALFPDEDEGERSSESAAFSRREMEVYAHLAEGKTASQMAPGIGLSRKTVETYIKNIQVKLGGIDITELRTLAARENCALSGSAVSTISKTLSESTSWK